MYNWHFEIIWEYQIVFYKGAVITAELTGLAFTIGVVLGLIIAFMRLSNYSLVRAPAAVYVELFRSTPALVQLQPGR